MIIGSEKIQREYRYPQCTGTGYWILGTGTVMDRGTLACNGSRPRCVPRGHPRLSNHQTHRFIRSSYSVRVLIITTVNHRPGGVSCVKIRITESSFRRAVYSLSTAITKQISVVTAVPARKITKASHGGTVRGRVPSLRSRKRAVVHGSRPR